MSRYPSAQWRPIRDTSTVAVRKDILCWHTIVGGGLSCWSYFDRLDVQVYSQGILCGIWGSDAGRNVDGLALQLADTDYRAAANLDGNWRIISWETADNGARPIAPWTPKMCDTMVEIMVDAHRLDGIPLVLIPDTKPGRRGVAYHRMGCDPYRVAGGEKWSTAYGKDCPTDPRIRQLPGLIDRARRIVDGQQEEDDVSAEDVWKYPVVSKSGAKMPAGDRLVDIEQDVDYLRREVNDVQAALARIEAALKPADPQP